MTEVRRSEPIMAGGLVPFASVLDAVVLRLCWAVLRNRTSDPRARAAAREFVARYAAGRAP